MTTDTKRQFSGTLVGGLAESVAQSAKGSARPISVPGVAMGNQLQIEQLKREIEVLKRLAEEGGDSGILLDPKDVKYTKWANRHEMAFHTEDFKQLKAKISHTKGNVQPIGVTKNENGQWVVVFGHRRLRACRDLGLKVRAVALEGEVSEDLLLLAMRHENGGQLPPSVWEQGKWFSLMLKEGIYKSQRELAEALGFSHTWVAVAIDAANIPDEVVKCWPNPVEIPTPAFKALKKAMESDGESVLLRAAVIRDRDEPLPVGAILKHLLHDDGEGPEEKPRKLALGKGKAYGTIRKDAQSRTVLVLDPAFRREEIQRLLKLAEEMAKTKPVLQEVVKPKAESKRKAASKKVDEAPKTE